MKKVITLTALLVCIVFIVSACGSVYSIETGMNTLTSDQMAGRQAGSEGGAAAAKYIQDQFGKLGLQQYTQPFRFQTYLPDQLKVSLTMTRSGGGPEELVLGTDYMPTRISKTAEVGGQITFDRNDANIGDKILVTDKLFSIRDIKNRPKGILLLEDPLVKRMEVRDSPLPVFSISRSLFDKLAKGGKTQMKMTINSTISPLVLQNVIGVIPGKNRKEAVILSAHYDGCGYDSRGIYKGAVDNASGVVTMLKAAQILSDYYRGNPPDVDIVFAAFDGEESGLIGSQYFMQQSDYKKLTDINIDCIGKDNIYVQSDSANIQLAQAISKRITGSQVLELGGVSDNMVFTFYNYPAVLITTLRRSDSGEIHTVKDTNDDVDRMLLLKLANDLANYMINTYGKVKGENLRTEEVKPSASQPASAQPSASQSAQPSPSEWSLPSGTASPAA